MSNSKVNDNEISFKDWQNEVRDLHAQKYDNIFGNPDEWDWDAWKLMWDEGLDPDEAIIEEIAAAST